MLDALNDADAEDVELKLSLLIWGACSLSVVNVSLVFLVTDKSAKRNNQRKESLFGPTVSVCHGAADTAGTCIAVGACNGGCSHFGESGSRGGARSGTVLSSPEARLSGFCPAVRHQVPKAPWFSKTSSPTEGQGLKTWACGWRLIFKPWQCQYTSFALPFIECPENHQAVDTPLSCLDYIRKHCISEICRANSLFRYMRTKAHTQRSEDNFW